MKLPPRLPPLPSINDILRLYGIRAKKRLSQNFIMDPSINQRLVRSLGDLEDKHVLEVGPGPGGITRALLERGAKRVVVIEKDPRFLPTLDLLREASEDRLCIKIGDVLNFNPQSLFEEELKKEWNEVTPNVRMIGNLPFNVATPLIVRLLNCMQERTNIFSFGRVPLLLTFQHEVAYRMVAPPGDPQRCRLSIFAQNYAKVSYKYCLPGGAFVPPPNVDVGVVKFVPLKKPYIDLPFKFVEKVVTAIFLGKKKSVEKTAQKLFPKPVSEKKVKKLLKMAEIDPEKLPIQLSLEEFEKICFSYKFIIENDSSLKDYVSREIRANLLTQEPEIKPLKNEKDSSLKIVLNSI